MTSISMGKNYEERMFGTVGGRYVSSIEIRVIFEYLEPRKDDNVLDVGTGTGRIARPLAGYVKELIGVDQDRTVLRAALIKAKLEGITNYSAVIGSSEYLPFREECFDKLVCVRSLKYFKDHMKSLMEMSFSLKNGGTLILEVSNILSWAVIVRLPKIFLTGSLGHPKLFTLRDITNKLWNNGFVIVDRYALHKVEPMLFNKINNRSVTRMLIILDSTLHKLTPFELFSRGAVLRCLKLS